MTAAVVAVFGGMPLWGDTVYFKDGSSLDGTVIRDDDSSVVLKLPRGRMRFPMGDVDRIEVNENVDSSVRAAPAEGDGAATAAAPSTLKELSEEDRTALRAMLGDLLSPEDAARDAARDRITRFGGTRDVFPFLERALPFMTDRQGVEVLHVLTELDPVRAAPVLVESAHSALDKNRAAALQLLGGVQGSLAAPDPEHLILLARGVLDSAPEVQLAAIRGLQSARDKRATPVLVRGLESADRRVHAASLEALHAIWAGANLEGDLNSLDTWRMLLSLADEDVRERLDPAQLEPLVTPRAAGDEDYNRAVD